MELSHNELQRIKVIENAVEARITVKTAAELLGLSERQVKRLKDRYRPGSVEWVRHGNLGRKRKWALKPSVRRKIEELARTKYAGLDDTQLTEKLVEAEGIEVSRETVRPVLRAAGIASPQKRRAKKYRARRERRPRLGEMVLADASRHDWLEGTRAGDDAGLSTKTIRGDFGELEIETPRDRNGEFEPEIVGKRQTTVGNFTEIVISLYARGMSTREIEEHVQQLYGIEISPQFVSRDVVFLPEFIESQFSSKEHMKTRNPLRRSRRPEQANR